LTFFFSINYGHFRDRQTLVRDLEDINIFDFPLQQSLVIFVTVGRSPACALALAPPHARVANEAPLTAALL
jgi:hypothetical protein